MKPSCVTKWMLCWLIAVVSAQTSFAQTFDSGSTGADGDLTFTTPGTYDFDPKGYKPVNGNIFNFTTITIASGVTVRVKADKLNAPAIWLAQFAVKIDGTIDLSGQDGFNAANTTQRTNTIPGSGGYPGGYPGVGSNPAGGGLGPAGGPTPPVGCGDSRYGQSGGFLGNQFLVPLMGGSGGGGGSSLAGGAGGGAILIASSVSISGAGSIKANGGASFISGYPFAGSGAGGGIRLVAPAVSLSGLLDARRGANAPCNVPPLGTPDGVVRIEAFQIGPINAPGTLYTATPFGLFLSTTGIPSVRVVSVGGNPVNTSPTGTFIVPDVTVNSNGPLAFVVQAANVPVGTVVNLVIFSENGPDLTPPPVALAGTLASSTATVSVTLPPGFSKGFVKAIFTQ